MDEIILFQDDDVKVTLKELIIRGKDYLLKDIVLTKTRIDEQSLIIETRLRNKEWTYEERTVFQSPREHLEKIHEALQDANHIRSFYKGGFANLPFFFRAMREVIQRRNITSLLIKPNDTITSLALSGNEDAFEPINFDH